MSLSIQEALIKSAEELYPLITKELSDQGPKKYNKDEWTLYELDNWKNIDLPQKLIERKESATGLHLTKDELALLMDWKLAKGKFRPTLPKLIQSNTEESVLRCTQEGFALFMDYINENDGKKWLDIALDKYKAILKASLKALCQLRGVGPATGSLMLSLLWKVTQFAPPFFSDESFMYFIRDSLRPSQPIKYTVREYIEELVPVVVNLTAAGEKSSPHLLEQGAWAWKMYQIYKIDRLADVKLPSCIEPDSLETFDAHVYLGDGSQKRLGTSEEGNRKRKKKE